MKYRHALPALLITLCTCDISLAQEVKSDFRDLKNNAIHFMPGLQALTLSYERKLWHPERSRALFKTFTARLEGGVFRSALSGAFGWEVEGYPSFYALSVSGLTGKGKNHLEFGFGVARGQFAEKIYCCLNGDWDIYPNLGYRFQKPGGRFVFRVGASHPRYTYISAGYAF